MNLVMLGTASEVMHLQHIGALPSYNWQRETFPYAEKISGESLRSKVIKDVSCFGCLVPCGKYSVGKDTFTIGPEYEGIFSMGTEINTVQSLTVFTTAQPVCDGLIPYVRFYLNGGVPWIKTSLFYRRNMPACTFCILSKGLSLTLSSYPPAGGSVITCSSSSFTASASLQTSLPFNIRSMPSHKWPPL